jgi:hypothetical protein
LGGCAPVVDDLAFGAILLVGDGEGGRIRC